MANNKQTPKHTNMTTPKTPFEPTPTLLFYLLAYSVYLLICVVRLIRTKKKILFIINYILLCNNILNYFKLFLF